MWAGRRRAGRDKSGSSGGGGGSSSGGGGGSSSGGGGGSSSGGGGGADAYSGGVGSPSVYDPIDPVDATPSPQHAPPPPPPPPSLYAGDAVDGVVAGAVAAVFLLPNRRGADKPAAGADADDAQSGGAWRVLFGMPTLRIIFVANALLFMAVSGVLLATVAVVVDSRQLYLFGMNAQGSSGLLLAVLMAARASTSLASGRVLDRSMRRTRLLLPSMALVATAPYPKVSSMAVPVASPMSSSRVAAATAPPRVRVAAWCGLLR